MTCGARPHVLRRSPAAWLLLLLTIGLVGCSGRQVVLTGTITDAYTGVPVPQASIVVGSTTITTDANGVFSTPRWQKTDTLAVSAPNYEAFSLPLANRPEVAASGVLTITLDTRLRPNSIAGLISDTYTGNPVPSAQIVATFALTSTLSVATDATGRYSLGGLPEQFALRVDAPGYATVEQTVNRATSLNLRLRPNVLSGKVTDRFSGQGVAGAKVTVGSASALTSADGSYRVEAIPTEAVTVAITADGYATLEQELGPRASLDAVLRPDTLKARLLDHANGAPIPNAAIIATTTFPGTDVAFTRIVSSTDGAFTLKGMPEQGYLQIIAPGYTKAVLPIKAGGVPSEIALDRFRVKALYLTAAMASSSSALGEYIDLIKKTELNALVIDLKSDLRDDLGTVYYDSQVPLVRELRLSRPYIDMPALLKRLKAEGIYTIGRVQLFSHDNVLSDARPDWSIKLRATGEVFADYPGPGIRYAYLDPTNHNVWDYNIQLGVEAAQLGFDEINFDYIRFPDWYTSKATFAETLLFSEPIDPVTNPERMFAVLTEFMAEAHRAINGAGAKMSIDIFGRVVRGKSLTIAQDIKGMGAFTDYIAPMPYPSLWGPGDFGLASPVEEPFKVIDATSLAGIEQIRGQYAHLRFWLQDHTDPWAYKVVKYGPVEVRAQIDAAEQYPEIDGWMLYDSANAYKGAFGGAAHPTP